jgi:hypothetical protein
VKVFNLQCDQGHGFEGWFGSEEDFRNQSERGLLSCPLCSSTRVLRLPSAPRLNLGAAAPASPAAAGENPNQSGVSRASIDEPGAPARGAAVLPEALQAQLLQAVRHLITHSDDVGNRFAEEARRIHYGEAEARSIRGQANAEEREALRDEGIEVFSLPVPPGFDGPLQ